MKNMICCSIVRQEELINNIKNQVYVIDFDYRKYKTKILGLVHNHDSIGLMKQLFWKPHCVLSIIVDKTDTRFGDLFYPLFTEICKQFSLNNGKFALFFLNCLFFQSFVLLEQSNNEKNKFLKTYFNWGCVEDTMGGCFYGIPLSSIVSLSTQSLIVNLILGKEYLKVLTFSGARNVCVN